MGTPDLDRAAILRRRARFVGSALAALCGCGRSTAPAAAAPEVVVLPAAADAGPEDAPAPPDAAARPPRAGNMPPVDVPPGAGDVARRHYEQIAASAREIHEKIDRAERALAGGCRAGSAACESALAAAAADVVEATRAVGWIVPLCQGSSSEARRVADRAEAHRRYAVGRIAGFEARVGAGDPAVADRWRALRQEAEAARPVPCLSIHCTDW